VQNYFKKNFTFQKIHFKHFSALDCFLNMTNDEYCHYSDLPSPMAYMNIEESVETKTTLSEVEIDRIIEMAWEDRTTFDAIKTQFGLSEAEVKKLMKKELKFSSYKLWRERVENCKTKHAKTRNPEIDRFKCNLQRTITHNKISKR
jgi:uncharacterized protein (TIGR03643 family)